MASPLASSSQEPVPPYALAPLPFPTLPTDDSDSLLHLESPAAIQQSSQRSIRCSESDGSHLYIGTSDGFVHSFRIGSESGSGVSRASSSDSAIPTPIYSLKHSRSISNHAKPVEKIVLLRPFNAAAVLCEGVVSFFSLPTWTPIRSLPSTRAVSTIVLDDEEAGNGTGTDAAGMISVCLVRRKNIILGKIGVENRSELLWATVKDIPLPGGAIFARRFADTLCIANATEYSLVNLSSGTITQLHLPISQTGESPSAQVRPSIVTVPVTSSRERQESLVPVVDRSGSASAFAGVRCEFLVTSHSGSITLGVFVKPSGEPAPKLLEWPSHPRSVTFDGKYLVSLLRNDTVEIHDLGEDSVDKVQTLQLPPGLDPRFLQPVQAPSSPAQVSTVMDSHGDPNDLDIVKASLAELSNPESLVLQRASDHAGAHSPSRNQILLCGRNSTSAVQQDSLLSWTSQQLHRGRLRNLRQSLDAHRQGTASRTARDDAVRTLLESSVAHALLGIELLSRANFSAAAGILRHAHLDPRVILGMFPEFGDKKMGREEAIMPSVIRSKLGKLKSEGADRLQGIDELITSNLRLNYSPPLDVATDNTLVDLRTGLRQRAEVLLRCLLEEWRSTYAAASARKDGEHRAYWLGSFMDEQMLANVNVCVDSAYLMLVAENRGVREANRVSIKDELNAFLASDHTCEPATVAKALAEKQFLSSLAEHYERNGDVAAALKIWTGLVDGELHDSLDEKVDAPAALSKIAALLTGQSDANLISKYGRWLVRKDPEAGIGILTKQTMPTIADGLRKPAAQTKAQELEAIQAQKATINELRDIDADAATKYLEVVALSTSKVQDEQMHRELAAALVRRVGQHLRNDEYRRRMEAVAQGYANGSYAESFFAHLALASNGSPSDMDRLKLAMLVQGSTVLDHPALLEAIAPLDILVYETAIILGKLGRDAEALSLLAITLRDANSAEAYCSQDGEVLSPMLATSIAKEHVALRPFSAMLSRTYAQRVKARAKAPASSGVQRKEELLKQLLSVYMANGAEEKFRIATAHLLNTQALHLDNRKVLELVPKDWSLATLETFLTQSLRRQLHRKREAQMLRNIAKCRNLDVAEDLWARQRAMGGILQDTEMDVGGDGGSNLTNDGDEDFSYSVLKQAITNKVEDPVVAEKDAHEKGVVQVHIDGAHGGYEKPATAVVQPDGDHSNDLS